MSKPLPPVDDMSYVVDKLFSPKIRAWIYAGGFTGIVGLLIAGVIANDEATQWLFFISGIVGLGGHGLAVANKPKPLTSENEEN